LKVLYFIYYSLYCFYS